MRIQVMSDLHLEFDKERFKEFINSLDPTGVDVLVLAGDICLATNMLPVMSAICKRYEQAQVLWVHGNHEYYGSTRERIHELSEQACKENSNLKWLDNNFVEIDGQRFLGTTLWFPWAADNVKWETFLNDFNVIRGGFRNWVYQENSKAQRFIKDFAREGDIVITHHLPSQKSVHPMYEKDGLNCFFVCDMEEDIKWIAPKLWIHGHTHHAFDYQVECVEGQSPCRVLCNPRGYPRETGGGFNKNLVVEI